MLICKLWQKERMATSFLHHFDSGTTSAISQVKLCDGEKQGLHILICAPTMLILDQGALHIEVSAEESVFGIHVCIFRSRAPTRLRRKAAVSFFCIFIFSR